MGAGAAQLISHFTLADGVTGGVITEFEVIATVDGSQGFVEEYSHMEKHLKHSANTVAQYLTTGSVVRY